MKKATLNKKVNQVNETLQKINESKSVVVVDYLGLSVAQISELRTNLYKSDIELKVVKNNILERAATSGGYTGIQEQFKGPSAVAYSKDATNAAKILFDFAKKNTKLQVKGGLVEGQFYNAKDLKVIANLPNKEGMVAMLLSVLQAPIRNLGCVIKAVGEKA